MFNTIVVAVDQSDAADAALKLATQLALQDKAALVLVNVVDVSKLVTIAGYETPYPIDAVQILREDGQACLTTAGSFCESQGLKVTTSMGEGDACDEILRIAKEHDAGLIALGTHGRKGLTRLFLGSVAEGVLRRAEVPVLVTRPHVS